MAQTRIAPRQAETREQPRMDVRDTPAKKQRLRKNTSSHSPTDIPREMIPPDVDLMWVVDTVHGQPDFQMRNAFEVNAWEPVLPEMWGGRFDGMFTPKGHKGEINVLGQVLMWRPLELSIESRAEEATNARMAKFAIEQKLRNGDIDGMKFDTQHKTARAVTYVSHENVQIPE
jgi:hypothetical protein